MYNIPVFLQLALEKKVDIKQLHKQVICAGDNAWIVKNKDMINRMSYSAGFF